jgi:hypothetical protein
MLNKVKGEIKMAINPIAQTDAAKVAAQAAATNTNQTQPTAKEPTPAKTQPAAVTDTVTISTAAQEAQETPVQTMQEASRGDRQAQRLITKEAAEKTELRGNAKPSILSPK